MHARTTPCLGEHIHRLRFSPCDDLRQLRKSRGQPNARFFIALAVLGPHGSVALFLHSLASRAAECTYAALDARSGALAAALCEAARGELRPAAPPQPWVAVTSRDQL
jgi:hypothetical protein